MTQGIPWRDSSVHQRDMRPGAAAGSAIGDVRSGRPAPIGAAFNTCELSAGGPPYAHLCDAARGVDVPATGAHLGPIVGEWKFK